jgi:hypothetical protein
MNYDESLIDSITLFINKQFPDMECDDRIRLVCKMMDIAINDIEYWKNRSIWDLYTLVNPLPDGFRRF